jgi:hypothetical protein
MPFRLQDNHTQTGLPQFRAVNTVLSNLKTGLAGTYHAFKFAKYATAVLEDKAATSTLECAGDSLDGNVASRTFGRSKGREHFTLGGANEIAIKPLV